MNSVTLSGKEERIDNIKKYCKNNNLNFSGKTFQLWDEYIAKMSKLTSIKENTNE